MKIQAQWENEEKKNYIVNIASEIDTTTSDELATYMEAAIIQNPKILSLDFSDVSYVTSAGLRVLLSTQKKIHENGNKMQLYHVNHSILSVFTMTGFIDILDIRKEGGERVGNGNE